MSAKDPLPSNRQAEILILQAMYRDLPVVGHCLGGQLMARALGGVVTDSPQPEIGWQPIEYEDNELAQEWFGTDPTNSVIHWHYESFSIPTGAVRVATSLACPNQAFAIGPHLAMQFHIEINETKINTWVNDDDPKWTQARAQYNSVQDKITMLNGIPFHLDKHQATADRIYQKWLETTEWSVV
jgi:GMP synthase-like glutamine amidotransferase